MAANRHILVLLSLLLTCCLCAAQDDMEGADFDEPASPCPDCDTESDPPTLDYCPPWTVPPPSLGERARQIREERANLPSVPRGRGQLLAEELENQQQEDAGKAPVGLKRVRLPELPYSLDVPQHARLQARDHRGVVFSSAGESEPSVIVIFGTPLQVQPGPPENMLGDAARQLFSLRCDSGRPTTIDGRPGNVYSLDSYYCNYGLYGYASLVLNDGFVYPVFCGLNQEGTKSWSELKGNRKAQNKAMGDSARDFGICRLLVHSVRFRNLAQRAIQRDKSTPVQTASLEPVQQASAGEEVSLGDVARASRQEPRKESKLRFDDSTFEPTADVTHMLRYCTKDECHTARVSIPRSGTCEKSQSISCTLPGDKDAMKLTLSFGGETAFFDETDLLRSYYRLGGSVGFHDGITEDQRYVRVRESPTENGWLGEYRAVFDRTQWTRTIKSITFLRVALATPGRTAFLACKGETSQFDQLTCERFLNSFRIDE